MQLPAQSQRQVPYERRLLPFRYDIPRLSEGEGEEDRKYVGSAKNFKKRYYGHAASFRDSDKKHNTALSTPVWERELNPEPEIEWSILAH